MDPMGRARKLVTWNMASPATSSYHIEDRTGIPQLWGKERHQGGTQPSGSGPQQVWMGIGDDLKYEHPSLSSFHGSIWIMDLVAILYFIFTPCVSTPFCFLQLDAHDAHDALGAIEMLLLWSFWSDTGLPTELDCNDMDASVVIAEDRRESWHSRNSMVEGQLQKAGNMIGLVYPCVSEGKLYIAAIAHVRKNMKIWIKYDHSPVDSVAKDHHWWPNPSPPGGSLGSLKGSRKHQRNLPGPR